jgi:hypothetical protein
MLELMLAAAAAAAQISQPACPIDRQVYRLQADRHFTAGFARVDERLPYASHLAFWLKSPTRTYWFSFHAPNGYGGTVIMPDVTPEKMALTLEEDAPEPPSSGGEEEQAVMIAFDAFRADLSVYDAPPQVDDPAPARIFARELGSALWYNAPALAGDPTAQHESMPISLFEPAGCAPDRPKVQRVQPRLRE